MYEEHLNKILEAQVKLPGDEAILELADFFDALGNPTRLKILLALMEVGELCTCDLSAISHQLRILKDRKIVAYRLDDEHIREILEIALKHMEE